MIQEVELFVGWWFWLGFSGFKYSTRTLGKFAPIWRLRALFFRWPAFFYPRPKIYIQSTQPRMRIVFSGESFLAKGRNENTPPRGHIRINTVVDVVFVRLLFWVLYLVVIMFFSGNYSYAAILYMFFCLFFKVNVQRTFNEHRLLVSWGRFFYFIPIPREMVGEIIPTLLSLGWCDFWFTPPGFDQHILRRGEHQSSRNGFP